VKDFSVFLLPHPHRLVVDVYGENIITAKASEPVSAPAGSAEAGKSDPAKSEKAAGKAPEKTPERAEAAKSEPAKADAGKAASGKAPVATAASAKESERERKEKEAAALLRAAEPPQPTRGGDMTVTRVLGLKVGRVVIDAGHGGHDTGTIGPTGAMEKEVCLDVALRLGAMLKEKMPGIEILYTREDDTFIPLEDRVAVANQARADLFISIHANSSRDRKARGIETYYLSFSNDSEALEIAARENALSQSSVNDLQDIIKRIARNERVEESRELAAELQDSLAARMKRVSRANKDRGVKKAPFVVLIGANMPSVLSEVSFLSNPTDESLLKKAEHRQRVAEGLFTGVRKYLESLRSVSYNRAAPTPAASR
jgi:N-acetylmuramoyl-L-alanine amidase